MPKKPAPPLAPPLAPTPPQPQITTHGPNVKFVIALAQQYAEKRAARLEVQHQAEAMEEEEKGMKDQLMAALKNLGTTAVSDGKKIYAIVTKDEPTCESWPDLWAYIQQTGEFDLLYRRINAAAIKERWDLNLQVPGVKKFPVEVLSITKAKGA